MLNSEKYFEDSSMEPGRYRPRRRNGDRPVHLKEKEMGAALNVSANMGMICIELLKHGCCQRDVALEPIPDS